MTALTEIYAALDAIRPQQCCSPDLDVLTCYRPAYVGPEYAGAKPRIMFVGLDPGTGERDNPTVALSAESWAGQIFEGKRNGHDRLDDHYKGCVRAAGWLLGKDCEHCRSIGFCSVKTPRECSLAQFCQTNAVKCAPMKKGKEFVGAKRIKNCLPIGVVREIEVLRPNIIICQGRRNHMKGIFLHFVQANGSASIDFKSEFIGTVEWNSQAWKGHSALAFLRHPSRGPNTDWELTRLPALKMLARLWPDG